MTQNLASRCPKLWWKPWHWTRKMGLTLVKGHTEGNECSESCIQDPYDDDKPPIGSQYMKCHMVFSIKMEDFSKKAHLVTGGHMVEAPKHLTFVCVVSRESVRIALTLAALNDFEVKTSDIQNAYLTAHVQKRCILH